MEVDGFGVEVDDGRSIGAQRKEKKKKKRELRAAVKRVGKKGKLFV